MGMFKKKWFYNTETGQVEYGRISKPEDLLGPFDTKEEAENALETVQRRNEEWVAQEQAGHPEAYEQVGMSEGEDQASPENSAKWQSFQQWVNDPQPEKKATNKPEDIPPAAF